MPTHAAAVTRAVAQVGWDGKVLYRLDLSSDVHVYLPADSPLMLDALAAAPLGLADLSALNLAMYLYPR